MCAEPSFLAFGHLLTQLIYDYVYNCFLSVILNSDLCSQMILDLSTGHGPQLFSIDTRSFSLHYIVSIDYDYAILQAQLIYDYVYNCLLSVILISDL